ncbi:FG-GAP-like repeat-containing protein [Micromonospora sp. WMMC241]|uniref:FG-GAP-like repeat-containing protein n=1 Tax=Micromonospora sp. WMMC241 TaxID=3015159 RepID=UPI0022B6EE84|nr:FG-GAP-like repeat-containing protein [Micromonospora sp. WMMC241]MCZ7438872.1 FG-GAP-like repeat-containing protein [Micromonospora sp. WMMC241]
MTLDRAAGWRRYGAAVLVGLLAITGVTVTRAAPASAVPGDGSAPFASYNMEGSLNGERWGSEVAALATEFPVVFLQEAGSGPPPQPYYGQPQQQIPVNRFDGGPAFVTHTTWEARRLRDGNILRHVYFAQTDPQRSQAGVNQFRGGRVNLAMVTDTPADEVRLIRNNAFANPGPGVAADAYRSRPVLGLRFGQTWYYDLHGRGNDIQGLLANIRAATRPGEGWILAGDFNVHIENRSTTDAESITLHLQDNEHLLRPGVATHDNGGEIDFAIVFNIAQSFEVTVPAGRGADHFPVHYTRPRQPAPVVPIQPARSYPSVIATDTGLHVDLTAGNDVIVHEPRDNDNQRFETLLTPGFTHALRNVRTGNCLGVDPLFRRTEAVISGIVPTDCAEPLAHWTLEDPAAPGGPVTWRSAVVTNACMSAPEVAFSQVLATRCDEARGQRLWTTGTNIRETQWTTIDTNLRLRSVATNGYLDVSGAGTADNAGVITYPYNNVANQRWRLEVVDPGDNLVRLRPEHATSKCLDVRDSDRVTEGRDAVIYHCDDPDSTNDGTGHRWLTEYYVDGSLRLRNEASHLCLQAPDGQAGPATVTACDDSPGQRWFVRYDGPDAATPPTPGPFPTDPLDDLPVRLPLKPRTTEAPDLRLLPLGDSITYGVGAAGGSSYRRELWESLQGAGGSVDFVGSLRSGQFADPDHEGHKGWRIDEIDRLVTGCTMAYHRPNVVTLHAGTNDMNTDFHVDQAPARLRALIDDLFALAPETTVLVATLVPSTDPAVNARIQRFNAQLPGVVADLRRAGRYVRLVDMNAVTTADLNDWLHPKASGYTKMATAFTAAVRAALRDGWVLPPATPDASGRACSPEAPSPSGGGDDGWAWQGVVATGAGVDRAEVRFADLDGDGRDDYLAVGNQGEVRAWLNAGASPGGGWGWKWAGRVASGVGATRDQVRFADLDGDHRADYLVVGDQGQVRAWLNTDTGSGLRWLNQGEVVPNLGASRAEVMFADISGDGRDDYLAVDEAGQVRGWFNNLGGSGAAWLPQGIVAVGVGASRDELTFTDVNGDGRDDYLVVGAEGQVRAWLNAVGGSRPWLFQGEIASGVGASRADVVFAEVNGDGRSDYLVVRRQGVVSGWFNDRFAGHDRWRWEGTVASGVNATRDQVRLTDINADGRADYLVVGDQGQLTAWLNQGRDTAGAWTWAWQGTIASGVNATRDQVRLTDINADGRADYLVVGDQGQLTAWLNQGRNTEGAWTWAWQGTIASVAGADRAQVRLADVNADGRADYLLVGDQGQVRSWLNQGRNAEGSWGWSYQGQIVSGVGATRDSVRFADIDGDRRDDYLVIDDLGRLRAWLNVANGAGMSWTVAGEIAAGVGVAGERVELADLDGDRRDDYLVLDDVGRIRAWTNH